MGLEKIILPFKHEKIPYKKVEKRKNRAKNTKGTLRRLWQYLKQEKKKLILVMIMIIGTAGLSLLGPFIIGRAIDTFIVAKKVTGFETVLLSLAVIYIIYAILTFFQNYVMVGIAQTTVHSLRKDLFKQFHRLPIAYFDQKQQGELMSRLTNDIDNVNTTLNQSVVQMFQSIVTLIGTVIVMLMLSPILTFVTFVIIPLLWLGIGWITKRTGPLYRKQQQDLGEMNGFIEETFSGLEVIKIFSKEHEMTEDFEQLNSRLNRSGFWAQTISGFIPKVMNFLNYLSFGLIALVGGLLAIKGTITVGVIVIFVEYARQFTRPLNDLANQFNTVLSAMAGAERVFTVLDEKPEELDENISTELNTTNGHFKFNHVTFGYENSVILQDISFEAKSGETVAFVGHTGAGKTTIINLIARFYDCDHGTITLDGEDIRKITRESLRNQMAFVLQDSFLFKDTIFENIRYGRLDATDLEIRDAADQANATSFIERLPDGFNTVLDETKTTISQGQKQLLAIARAIIARPRILILDEATSNIDTITEIQIQEALKNLMKDKTSFVIAHRLNTIQEADHIILLEKGRIVEQGTHTELLNLKGNYRYLYQ